MNFIAGYLILITKNEEESFWLLDALVGRILPGSSLCPAPSLPPPRPASHAFDKVWLARQDGVKWLGCNSGVEHFLAFLKEDLGFNPQHWREGGEGRNLVKTWCVEAEVKTWVSVVSAEGVGLPLGGCPPWLLPCVCVCVHVCVRTRVCGLHVVELITRDHTAQTY